MEIRHGSRNVCMLYRLTLRMETTDLIPFHVCFMNACLKHVLNYLKVNVV